MEQSPLTIVAERSNARDFIAVDVNAWSSVAAHAAALGGRGVPTALIVATLRTALR